MCSVALRRATHPCGMLNNKQVAPRATPMLQRLCDAVASNGGEDKARTAADANPAVKGEKTDVN